MEANLFHLSQSIPNNTWKQTKTKVFFAEMFHAITGVEIHKIFWSEGLAEGWGHCVFSLVGHLIMDSPPFPVSLFFPDPSHTGREGSQQKRETEGLGALQGSDWFANSNNLNSDQYSIC